MFYIIFYYAFAKHLHFNTLSINVNINLKFKEYYIFYLTLTSCSVSNHLVIIKSRTPNVNICQISLLYLTNFYSCYKFIKFYIKLFVCIEDLCY